MGIIEGATSGNKANVTTEAQLKVIHPSTINTSGNPTTTGYMSIVCESDAGNITGTVLKRQCDASGYYRQRVATDTLIFANKFCYIGSAANSNPHSANWTIASSVMTFGVADTGFTLNSGASSGTGEYALLTSRRVFTVYDGFPLQFSCTCTITGTAGNPQSQIEFGLALVATNATPTDGAYFLITTAGALVCRTNYNGSITTVTPASGPTYNVMHTYLIVITNSATEFWIDNVMYANMPFSGAGSPTISNVLPIYYRTIGGGPGSNAISLTVHTTSVTLGDMLSGKTWSEIQGGTGLHSAQFFVGANVGASIGTTATYTNSLAPGAGVVLTNNTVATTGLGGQIAVQPTLAADTDGILWLYLVPDVSTTSITRNLIITGIAIQGAVTATLTGGPVTYAYSLAYGGTAVDMATTESVTAKAFRRIPLRFETYAAAAAAGTIGVGLTVVFASPILVAPGEYVGICAKNLGTVTSAGVITILARLDGYWE